MTNYLYKEGNTWYAAYENPNDPAAWLLGPSERAFDTKKEAQAFLNSLKVETTEAPKSTKAKRVKTPEQKAKAAERRKARREAKKEALGLV